MQADGQRIQDRREELGYSQTRFAKAARISRSHMCRIESGDRDPSPEVLTRIVELLGWDISDIRPQGEKP